MIDLYLRQWSQQGSTNCSILSSRMGEHGESQEITWRIWRTRRTWKYGKHQPHDLKQSIYDLEHIICDSKHLFFGNQMTQNTLSYGLYVDGPKKHNIHQALTTCAALSYIKAHREHDPGSAQNGKTSTDLWSPGSQDSFKMVPEFPLEVQHSRLEQNSCEI